jgi:hypothetical protein
MKTIDSKVATESTSSRRRFLTGAVAATAGASALVAAPHVARAQEMVIKMQGAWGGGIFKEFAIDYTNRVNEMSGGSLRIDYLDVDAVVKTPEMQTAVHNGVLDAAHHVTAYWYSKHAAASLFGTGPCWGWNANQLIGWFAYGGGRELYEELMWDILGLNLVGFLTGPMPAQPFGWFNKAVNTVADIQGLKYRTVGLPRTCSRRWACRSCSSPAAKSSRRWSAASSTRPSSTTRPRTRISACRTCRKTITWPAITSRRRPSRSSSTRASTTACRISTRRSFDMRPRRHPPTCRGSTRTVTRPT